MTLQDLKKQQKNVMNLFQKFKIFQEAAKCLFVLKTVRYISILALLGLSHLKT